LAVLELTAGGRANIHADPALTAILIDGSNDRDSVFLSSTSNTSLDIDGRGGHDGLGGGAAADILRGGSGDDSLYGSAGDDVNDGGSGNDTAVYAVMQARVTIDLGLPEGEPQNTGGAGIDRFISIENLVGSDLADVLSGDAAANVIEGRGDNGAGVDVLNGRGGIDTVSYRTAGAAIIVDLAIAGAQNTGGAGEDRILNFENVTGSSADDEIYGNSGNNQLNGGGSADTLLGRGGTDRIFGENGNDTLFGEAGNDFLAGGEGNDELWGDAGTDRLRGGGGADMFNLGALGGSEMVIDFEDGIDHLHFQGFGAAFDTAAEILARASQAGGAVQIVLPSPAGGSARMIIVDFLLADLDASDLIL
jgi:Ca2+-binding RTX toxin-like protein